MGSLLKIYLFKFKKFIFIANKVINISMINEAIESYHSAIKLKSNFAEAYNNLGLIMMDQNKIIEA